MSFRNQFTHGEGHDFLGLNFLYFVGAIFFFSLKLCRCYQVVVFGCVCEREKCCSSGILFIFQIEGDGHDFPG